MRKKNSLRIKWMLGILISLLAIFFWPHKSSQNTFINGTSKISLQNGYFQFWASLFGMNGPGSSSDQASKENNRQNPNLPGLGLTGELNAMSEKNQSSTTGESLSTSQGPAGSQNGNNRGLNSTSGIADNSEINSETSSETNSEAALESTSETNSGTNPETNSETNAESSLENNTNQETGNLSADNQGNNPGNSTETNSDQGTGNLSGNISRNASNGNQAPINPIYLPTINPIPSDSAVSQGVSQQNQQRDNLAALLAARQALVVPIQEEAQNTKYQPVTVQSAPDPNATPITSDTLAKMKAGKIIVSH